jgi:hypothetical protein
MPNPHTFPAVLKTPVVLKQLKVQSWKLKVF